MDGRSYWALGAAFCIVTGCDSAAAPEPSSTTTVPRTTTTTEFIYAADIDAQSHFVVGTHVNLVGVAFDEYNWVQLAPIFTTSGGIFPADRLDANLVATGVAYASDEGVVWEQFESDLQFDGAVREFFGYFPQEYLGVVGTPEDGTSEVANLSGDSVEDLAAAVAVHFGESRSLEVVQITRRDFGGRELYYDLIGSVDNQTMGYRLYVLAQEDGDSFRVARADLAPICIRGLDETGECVAP